MNKLLIGMAMTAVATAAVAQSKLNAVEWTKVGDGLQVNIKGTDLGEPKVLRAWGGKSYLLEFNAALGTSAKKDAVNFAGVEYIQATWFTPRPAKVRVHLRLDPTSDIQLVKAEDGWTVNVNVKANAAKGNSGIRLVKETTNNSITATVPAPTVRFEAGKTEPKKAEPKKAEPKKSGEMTLNDIFASNDPGFKVVATPKPINTPLPKPKANGLNFNPNTLSNIVPAKTEVQGRVDLEFVNTDVVQVLRAIALDGDVNIVTASDVKGTITVSLNRVSVLEALNLVTALAGLTYAKAGNTYVVAADPARLRAFSQMGGTVDTRVVPIFSGQGSQVKSAVMKSANFEGGGTFDIALPSESAGAEAPAGGGSKPADAESGNGGGGANQGGGNTGGGSANNATGGSKDTYVVLIGPAARLDALEKSVRRVDEQICAALGIDVPNSTAMVRKTYSPKGTKATFLLAAVGGGAVTQMSPNYAKIGNVEVFATPLTSVGDQILTLYGRQNEVDRLMANIEAIDQVAEGSGDVMVYDVKFMDPRGLKQDLEQQFPGLDVALIAANAGSPGLFKESSTKQSASGGEQSSSTSSQSSAGSAEVKTETGSLDGITLPFSELEKQAYGMKIRLRGPQAALEQAMAYLSKVDVSPKQIAIELRVMDLSREEGLRLGIDWSMITSGGVNIFRVNQGTGESAGVAGNASTSANIGRYNANVTATLDSIANNRNLIARPNMFAYDGRQSELFVGDVIRYIESIQSTQTGITVTTKELPVGVRLAVLPRIGGDGEITMDVRPVVSTLNGFTNVPGGGQLPQTSLRIAQNTLNISSGETIAIGGLIQENDVKRTSGIPILKDLPFLGKLLFSRTDNSKRRTELVFFLTAKVVERGNRGDAADPRHDRPTPPPPTRGGN
jgi:type II secretory pathway component GspD/PulD (secretin)/uncharacterized protein YggU (UPF0235/DUF167 family)